MQNKRQKTMFLARSSLISQTRAQISDTIMWVVATLIIIFILTISIFVVSTKLGGNKQIIPTKTTDTIATKSLFSFLLTKSDSTTNYERLKENDLDKFNGSLAQDIFLTSNYKKDYPKDIWLGIDKGVLSGNSYFGIKPRNIRRSFLGFLVPFPFEAGTFKLILSHKLVPYVSKKIKLEKDRYFEMVLMWE